MNTQQSPYCQQPATFAIEMIEWMHRRRCLPGVSSVEVEPVRRRSARITLAGGGHRFAIGSDLGINVSASCDIAADKFLTKDLLSSAGIQVPRGALLDLEGQDDGSAASYPFPAGVVSGSLPAFPMYVKPIYGSCGDGVFRVADDVGLAQALGALRARRHRWVAAEEEVTYPEFRLVVLDGRCRIAYAREPMRIVGDGESTIEGLIQDLASNRDWDDARCADAMAFVRTSGEDLASTPAAGRRIRLSPVSNLSAGGWASDVSTAVHDQWSSLGASVASLLGLRLCGIDLACESLASPTAAYAVIEVNSAPSLSHYARLGDRELRRVMALFAMTFAQQAALAGRRGFTEDGMSRFCTVWARGLTKCFGDVVALRKLPAGP